MGGPILGLFLSTSEGRMGLLAHYLHRPSSSSSIAFRASLSHSRMLKRRCVVLCLLYSEKCLPREDWVVGKSYSLSLRREEATCFSATSFFEGKGPGKYAPPHR